MNPTQKQFSLEPRGVKSKFLSVSAPPPNTNEDELRKLKRTQTTTVSAIAMGVILLFAGGVGTVSAIDFFDGTFTNSDWSAFKALDSTPGQLATFTVGQAILEGNPGPYRMGTHGNGYSGGTIYVANVRNDAVHDPKTCGAIVSVEYSLDAQTLSSGVVLFCLLALQDGKVYTGGDFLARGGWGWVSGGGVLQSADFFLLSGGPGPLHPDFSGSGAPIGFGYATGNSSYGFQEFGIDNWWVRLNLTPAFLTITRSSSDSVILSWPTAFSCFVLQESPTLGTTNWLAVGTPPTVNGSNLEVAVASGVSNRFFRLMHP